MNEPLFARGLGLGGLQLVLLCLPILPRFLRQTAIVVVLWSTVLLAKLLCGEEKVSEFCSSPAHALFHRAARFIRILGARGKFFISAFPAPFSQSGQRRKKQRPTPTPRPKEYLWTQRPTDREDQPQHAGRDSSGAYSMQPWNDCDWYSVKNRLVPPPPPPAEHSFKASDPAPRDLFCGLFAHTIHAWMVRRVSSPQMLFGL